LKTKHGRIHRVAILIFVLALAFSLAACNGPEQKAETKTVVVGLPVEPGNANSTESVISADGNKVAFTSEATNLLKSTTFGRNIFLKDIDTGVVSLVSTNTADTEGNGDSEQPAISSDGRFVVFASSATDLVAEDTNDLCINASGVNVNCTDVFLKDTQTGTVAMVSVDTDGIQGDGFSQQPAVSSGGHFVAFASTAANLVPDDINEASDVFIKDTTTGTLQVISARMDATPGNGESGRPAISADGLFVAFSSNADDLVEDDGNGTTDVFIKDTLSGAMVLVSSDAAGTPGNKASGFDSLSLSADGRYVIFESAADNLVEGDVNEKRDVFLKDTQTGAIVLVSTDATGVQGEDDSYLSVAVTSDGAMAFFSSNANNLVPGDTVNKADIFRKNVQTGAIDIIAIDSAGSMADGTSERLAITPDGLFVVFSSDAINLVADDNNSKTDIFRKDVQTGETVIVSNSTT
jgi:Tol biopolymer transport system component